MNTVLIGKILTVCLVVLLLFAIKVSFGASKKSVSVNKRSRYLVGNCLITCYAICAVIGIMEICRIL